MPRYRIIDTVTNQQYGHFPGDQKKQAALVVGFLNHKAAPAHQQRFELQEIPRRVPPQMPAMPQNPS